MRKLILTVATVAMLAVPSAAMASQPANPGSFGTVRAATIGGVYNGSILTGADWGAIAADRAGDNGTINQDWMLQNDSLPAGVTPGQL
jgi:hypothetical protein